MSVGVVPAEPAALLPPIVAYLETVRARHAGNDAGEVASYIPELAKVDPSLFGICLATVGGAVYEIGDTDVPFTIQSISKPLTYGLALSVVGEARVRERIGVEPSGDPFNEISLDPARRIPVNPMINAGAIACAGLVVSVSDDAESVLLDTYSGYAGRRLALDEAVYRSEAETGHRNRAIAHLLRSVGAVDVDPEAALDLYFRQCSVAVDCRDLALVAATLANGGVNPRTGERALLEDDVRRVLSVMTTCGMYDGAGEWLVSVGLPAKSGVSGGVLGVLPGRLGVAVFSPRLDARGNSVRGVAVCRDLSQELALHLVRPGEQAAPPVRGLHTLGEMRSRRARTSDERAAIRAAADRTAVLELQGELGFHAVEAVSRAITDRSTAPEIVVVDLRRVVRADRGGLEFLPALAAFLAARGGRLAISQSDLEVDLSGSGTVVFDTLDRALEWCEDELLARLGRGSAGDEVPVVEHGLLAGLDAAEIHALLERTETVRAEPGTVLVRAGDPAAELFLIARGSLSVLASSGGPVRQRLTTLSAGMAFGELAYVDGGVRSADVVADTAVECRRVPYALLDELAERSPALYGKLLRNVLRVAVDAIRVSNEEVSLSGR